MRNISEVIPVARVKNYPATPSFPLIKQSQPNGWRDEIQAEEREVANLTAMSRIMLF
jgi:hypothetical protein